MVNSIEVILLINFFMILPPVIYFAINTERTIIRFLAVKKFKPIENGGFSEQQVKIVLEILFNETERKYIELYLQDKNLYIKLTVLRFMLGVIILLASLFTVLFIDSLIYQA